MDIVRVSTLLPLPPKNKCYKEFLFTLEYLFKKTCDLTRCGVLGEEGEDKKNGRQAAPSHAVTNTKHVPCKPAASQGCQPRRKKIDADQAKKPKSSKLSPQSLGDHSSLKGKLIDTRRRFEWTHFLCSRRAMPLICRQPRKVSGIRLGDRRETRGMRRKSG